MRKTPIKEWLMFYKRNYNVMELKVVQKLLKQQLKELQLWQELKEEMKSYSSYKIEELNGSIKVLNYLIDNHKAISTLQIDLENIETL